MSKELKYKQATNVERRRWDTKEYEAKAQARTQNQGPTRQAGEKRKLEQDVKEEFTPAAAGAAGPEKSDRAFLKARKRKVDIDSKVGVSEMVSVESVATTSARDVSDGVTKTGVGWHCRVCDCFLKDSHTYLDHINGRKHQRALGYSMRVERSTKEQVEDRLKTLLTKKQQSPENPVAAREILKAKDEMEQKLKEERRKRREERKKKHVQAEQENEETGESQVDPAIASMMGFSGFGGSVKNR